MAPRWPKLDSRVDLASTTQRAIHLNTYCESVRNHYETHKQATVSSETFISLAEYVQQFCIDVLEIKYDERLDEVVNTVKEARNLIDYTKEEPTLFKRWQPWD